MLQIPVSEENGGSVQTVMTFSIYGVYIVYMIILASLQMTYSKESIKF